MNNMLGVAAFVMACIALGQLYRLETWIKRLEDRSTAAPSRDDPSPNPLQ